MQKSEADLKKFKEQEFTKISETFAKMRKALEHREQWFKE
jgi:hypothetical protein